MRIRRRITNRICPWRSLVKSLTFLNWEYFNKIPLIIITVIVIAREKDIESICLARKKPWAIPAKYATELRIIWRFKIDLYAEEVCRVVKPAVLLATYFFIFWDAIIGIMATVPVPIDTQPKFSTSWFLPLSANADSGIRRSKKTIKNLFSNF